MFVLPRYKTGFRKNRRRVEIPLVFNLQQEFWLLSSFAQHLGDTACHGHWICWVNLRGGYIIYDDGQIFRSDFCLPPNVEETAVLLLYERATSPFQFMGKFVWPFLNPNEQKTIVCSTRIKCGCTWPAITKDSVTGKHKTMNHSLPGMVSRVSDVVTKSAHVSAEIISKRSDARSLSPPSAGKDVSVGRRSEKVSPCAEVPASLQGEADTRDRTEQRRFMPILSTQMQLQEDIKKLLDVYKRGGDCEKFLSELPMFSEPTISLDALPEKRLTR